MKFPELPESFAELLKTANSLPDRPVGEETLTVLRDSSPNTPGVRQMLEHLRTGAAVAVVTGQQLGLFLGPALTFYKIASVVSLAKALSEAGPRPVVPIFWLQADDHDYDEVRAIHLPNEDGPEVTLELPKGSYQDEKLSVGRRTIPPETQGLLSELESRIGNTGVLASHYRTGSTFVSAFSQLVSSIFVSRDILFYNPLHPAAKKEASSLFLRSFLEHEAIEDSLSSRTNELASAGMKEQVYVRESSPLFFVHDPAVVPDGSGGRFRIREKGGRWEAIGGNFSLTSDELSTLIRDRPSAISPSALLRPLLQDSLFPTLAYIGGDAEIRYLLQLTSAYALLGIRQPYLVRRMSASIFEPKARRLLRDLETSESEFLFNREGLEARLRGALPSTKELEERLHRARAALDSILEGEALAVGGDMERVVRRAEDKFRRAVAGVLVRYDYVLKNRSDAELTRYRKLSNLLFPSAHPQERSIGAIYYWLRYGDSFTDAVLEEAKRWTQSLDGKTRIVSVGE